MIKALILTAAFAILIFAPCMGEQYATNQAHGSQVTTGSQVSPNITSAAALNVTPQQTPARINVNITNVSYLMDEWVMISNRGNTSVNLAGWTLTDGVRFRYVFPSVLLPAGYAIRIHPGFGFETPGNLYLSLSGDMLPDTGDTMMLLDPSGAVVSRYSYTGLALPPQEVIITPGAVPPQTLERGVLLPQGNFSPPARGSQIRPNATSTYVTELANVPVIFGTNASANINITNVEVTGDEFVEVTNMGLVPVNLTGWRLVVDNISIYTFPTTTLPIDESLRIHLGAGPSTPLDIYLSFPQPVLNDTSGAIVLLDQNGTPVSSYSYTGGTNVTQGAAAPGLVKTPGTEPVLLGTTAPGVTTGPSPSGVNYLEAPISPLSNVTRGEATQTIVGQPESAFYTVPQVSGSL